jgi:hypothetical protein
MVPENDREREEKAVSLAEERGRRQQLVDGRLNSHEERLDSINGSIERSALAQEATARELAKLSAKIDTAEAVAVAVNKAAVSRREFWLAFGAIIAILIGAIISSGIL